MRELIGGLLYMALIIAVLDSFLINAVMMVADAVKARRWITVVVFLISIGIVLALLGLVAQL